MSQINYFYQENCPNIIVSSSENINLNVPPGNREGCFRKIVSFDQTFLTEEKNICLENLNPNIPLCNIEGSYFRNAVPMDQIMQGVEAAHPNINIPVTQEYVHPYQLPLYQVMNCSCFQPPPQGLQWQNNFVQNQSCASFNFRTIDPMCPNSSEVLPLNYTYYPVPQYTHSYSKPNCTKLEHLNPQHEILQKGNCETKNSVTSSISYEKLVDSFVKENLESLKKGTTKRKSTEKPQFTSSEKKIRTSSIIKSTETNIKTNNMPVSVTKPEKSQKEIVINNKLICGTKPKIKSSIDSAEKSPSWASKYLQSISQEQQSCKSQINSRKNISNESKLVNSDSTATTMHKIPKDQFKKEGARHIKDVNTKDKATLNKQCNSAIILSGIRSSSISNKNKTDKCSKTTHVLIDKESSRSENSKQKKQQIEEIQKKLMEAKTKIENEIYSLLNKSQTKNNVKINACAKKVRSVITVPALDKTIIESPTNETIPDLRLLLDGKKILGKQEISIVDKTHLNESISSTKDTEKDIELNKPVKKINLVINIVQDSHQENNCDSDESQPDVHDDLGFLDDLDINGLVECLNDCNDELSNEENLNKELENNAPVDYIEEHNTKLQSEEDQRTCNNTEVITEETIIEEQLARIFAERSQIIIPENVLQQPTCMPNKTENNFENSYSVDYDINHTKRDFTLDSIVDIKINTDSNSLFRVTQENSKIISDSGEVPQDIAMQNQSSIEPSKNIESLIAQILGEDISDLPILKTKPIPVDVIDLTIDDENSVVVIDKTRDKFEDKGKATCEEVLRKISKFKINERNLVESNAIDLTGCDGNDYEDVQKVDENKSTIDYTQEEKQAAASGIVMNNSVQTLPQKQILKDNLSHEINNKNDQPRDEKQSPFAQEQIKKSSITSKTEISDAAVCKGNVVKEKKNESHENKNNKSIHKTHFDKSIKQVTETKHTKNLKLKITDIGVLDKSKSVIKHKTEIKDLKQVFTNVSGKCSNFNQIKHLFNNEKQKLTIPRDINKISNPIACTENKKTKENKDLPRMSEKNTGTPIPQGKDLMHVANALNPVTMHKPNRTDKVKKYVKENKETKIINKDGTLAKDKNKSTVEKKPKTKKEAYCKLSKARAEMTVLSKVFKKSITLTKFQKQEISVIKGKKNENSVKKEHILDINKERKKEHILDKHKEKKKGVLPISESITINYFKTTCSESNTSTTFQKGKTMKEPQKVLHEVTTCANLTQNNNVKNKAKNLHYKDKTLRPLATYRTKSLREKCSGSKNPNPIKTNNNHTKVKKDVAANNAVKLNIAVIKEEVMEAEKKECSLHKTIQTASTKQVITEGQGFAVEETDKSSIPTNSVKTEDPGILIGTSSENPGLDIAIDKTNESLSKEQIVKTEDQNIINKEAKAEDITSKFLTSAKISNPITPKTELNKSEENVRAADFKSSEDRTLILELERRMLSYLEEGYKVINKLHEGGFSTIYKCVNSKRQEFAVKVLRRTENRSKCAIMKKEMIMSYQKDIPKENLKCVYLINSFGLWNSRWVFLMEYYPKNVQQYLREAGSFHIDALQLLAQQLVGAVIMLRNYNIVHSDIRPNHLLINAAGNCIKLCGFDRSYYSEPQRILPNIGTINYRAPEVIVGYSASFELDVWSTAVVLYEMASGSQLFPGKYNNEILFKQQCLCGDMPFEMLKNNQFSRIHFSNGVFIRQVGLQHRIAINKFFRHDKVGAMLHDAYARDWLHTRTTRQIQCDTKKLLVFQKLLERMLVLHPRHRLPIEFVYTDPFIFKST